MIEQTKMNPIKKNHDAMLRTGAVALAAAGASTAAHAATVQITFNNSFLSNTSGTAALDTDIGNDLIPDLIGRLYRSALYVSALHIDGTFVAGAVAVSATSTYNAFVRVAGVGDNFGNPVALSGLVGITFNDANIRGGGITAAWIDVTASGGDGVRRVDVHRVIFDDASGLAPTGLSHSSGTFPEFGAAVPEPSGLGLLALGAGGLLARRRRAMAA